VAAIGGIMIPAMLKQGYDKNFAVATQASAGCIGVIIPPSIPMITFGVVTGTSIGSLFLGGFIPGALFGLVLMTMAYFMARKRKYAGAKAEIGLGKALKTGIWAILLPVLILGGIYSGWFTPTEAANIAVVYGFIVSFFIYKELKLKDIPAILSSAAMSSALVMLLIATATAFGVILTREQIPSAMAKFFISITTDPFMFLVIVNVLLLIIGTFIETNAAIILLAPILFPVVLELNINPIHFGIIMVINLAIGMVTPPLGVNLFVACGLSGLKVESILSYVWKYLIGLLIFLLFLTYFPGITLWLPKILS
jgi:C4-dicarboxylate transporter DctM subunit